MKDTEKALLRQALVSSNKETVNTACRNILSSRLQWEEQLDRNLRFLLDDIVKQMSFNLSYEIKNNTSSKSSGKSGNIGLALIFFIVVGFGFWLGLRESMVLRIIGLAAMTICGLGAGYCIKRTPAPVESHPELVISTTADELEKEIEAVYEAISALYNYRQLEGRQIKILLWFQQMHSDEKISKEIKESIVKLLKQFDYSFVDFTPDRSPDFELSMGNVETPQTTEQAVINQDGQVVCKGSAVLPKLKD